MLTERFSPYLFLILKPGVNIENVIEQVEKHRIKLPGIIDVKHVKRRFFGDEVVAIQVYCRSPLTLSKQGSILAKIEGVRDHVFDDIRPSSQYLLDRGLKPSGWINIESIRERVEGDVVEHRILRVKDTEEHVRPPNFRTLAFSVVYHCERGTPDPSRDPVLLISLLNDEGELRQFKKEDLDDRKILRDFADYVLSYDPDLIVGFENNRFHWDYLIERSRRHNIKLDLSRSKTEPHRSVYGHVSITGRANIDLYELADQIGEIEIKTLDQTADFFGVSLDGRIEMEQADVASRWRTEEGRAELCKHGEQDARLIIKILEKNIDFIIQLSHLTGLPLDHVLTAAVGFKVESYLLYEAFASGELPPRRVEQRYFTYTGGLVMKPKIGLHEDIAVLDFKSMYPSLMVAYNISPDTYRPEAEDEVNVVTVDGYRFRGEPSGLYKEVITRLMRVRGELRESYKRAQESAMKSMFMEREKAVKTLTNALYGYAGWTGARWFIREVAEATASLGRKTLTSVLEKAKTLGLEIIYSDTDSVFVEYDREKVERLQRWVADELKMEFKLEHVFRRIVFSEAKKKYAGITTDGTINIVGMEAVRSDWANIARKTQREVLQIILEGRPVQEAVKAVEERIAEVRSGEVAKKDLVVWKTLTRPVDKYEVNAPHVVVSKRLIEEGVKLKVGDMIGFVVLKGPGRIYERAEHYPKAKVEDIDYEYYVKSQISPAVMRILQLFGIKEEELITGREGILDSFL